MNSPQLTHHSYVILLLLSLKAILLVPEFPAVQNPQVLAYCREPDIITAIQPVEIPQWFRKRAVGNLRIFPGLEISLLIPAEGAVIKFMTCLCSQNRKVPIKPRSCILLRIPASSYCIREALSEPAKDRTISRPSPEQAPVVSSLRPLYI